MADVQISLAELVLCVKDVKRSANFYHHALGLALDGEPNDVEAWLWIGEPGASQSLGLRKSGFPYETYSPNPADRRWGATHFTFVVPADQLGAALARVRVQGIEVRGLQHAAPGSAFYFYDFDGNLISLRAAA